MKANVLVGDPFAREGVIATVDSHDSAERSLARGGRWMNGESGERFGISGLQIHRDRSGLDSPSVGRFQFQLATHRARRSGHANLHRLEIIVTENEDAVL